MTKEEKNQLILELKDQLDQNPNIYLADISNLNAEDTSNLRRMAFKSGVQLRLTKNTLLRKAMEASEKNFDELYDLLKGTTSIMLAETGKAPAVLIKQYRKETKREKPLLKGAYVEETCFVGENQLEVLANIKSKNELIAELVALLQSPAKNVISALQSGGNTLSGVLKTLGERE